MLYAHCTAQTILCAMSDFFCGRKHSVLNLSRAPFPVYDSTCQPDFIMSRYTHSTHTEELTLSIHNWHDWYSNHLIKFGIYKLEFIRFVWFHLFRFPARHASSHCNYLSCTKLKAVRKSNAISTNTKNGRMYIRVQFSQTQLNAVCILGESAKVSVERERERAGVRERRKRWYKNSQ